MIHAPVPAALSTQETPYLERIKHINELARQKFQYLKADRLAISIDCDGAPLLSYLRGIAFAWSSQDSMYLPLFWKGKDMGIQKPEEDRDSIYNTYIAFWDYFNWWKTAQPSIMKGVELALNQGCPVACELGNFLPFTVLEWCKFDFSSKIAFCPVVVRSFLEYNSGKPVPSFSNKLTFKRNYLDSVRYHCNRATRLFAYASRFARKMDQEFFSKVMPFAVEAESTLADKFINQPEQTKFAQGIFRKKIERFIKSMNEKEVNV